MNTVYLSIVGLLAIYLFRGFINAQLFYFLAVIASSAAGPVIARALFKPESGNGNIVIIPSGILVFLILIPLSSVLAFVVLYLAVMPINDRLQSRKENRSDVCPSVTTGCTLAALGSLIAMMGPCFVRH